MKRYTFAHSQTKTAIAIGIDAVDHFVNKQPIKVDNCKEWRIRVFNPVP